MYRVRWNGYDRTGDTLEPIKHLQGYANMVKSLRNHMKKMCIKGLTSPVWTLGMFQMVSGDSCQCNGKLSGHDHVKRKYPDVVRMWRQFHDCPGSGGGIERVFTAVEKTA